MSSQYPFIPYTPARIEEKQAQSFGTQFYENLDRRRSVRAFSNDAVPKELISLAIQAASTAPSGAHRQPWTFVAVSNPEIKRDIRIAAEQEELKNYSGRMSEEWIRALAPLGTDSNKSYLETVPWVVVVFAHNYGVSPDGSRHKNYYVKESVGIACGLFIAALHTMGLATLPHTPSPMRFLSEILSRPKNEQAMILFPIGYPAKDCSVPDIKRKELNQVAVWKT
jgi:iodotyrosine deiodinase